MKKIIRKWKQSGPSLRATEVCSSVLLSLGYDLKSKERSKIHRAASSGNVPKIRKLLLKQDINKLDKENRTPLYLACANGHLDAVKLLVKNKAKVNLCDKYNHSPLMKAIQCQHGGCAAILLQHEADPNATDNNGNTALHLAVVYQSMYIPRQLLEHGARIDAVNMEGCTPLILAVIENQQAMAMFLITEGAKVNCQDKQKRTSLMIAAGNGNISIVKYLLENNADTATKDQTGCSADDYAIMNEHHECSYLINTYYTRNKDNVSPDCGGGKTNGVPMFSRADRVQESFTLGSPAIHKIETDDLSASESESCASDKANSWPSDDEDFDFTPKKASKPNLSQLLHTERNAHGKCGFITAQAADIAQPVTVQPDGDTAGRKADLMPKVVVEEKDVPWDSESNEEMEEKQQLESLTKPVAVLSQPSERMEKLMTLTQHNITPQDEISLLKQQMEQIQYHCEEMEIRYIYKNEMLKEKIKDLRKDLKIHEGTLTQTVIQYNGQLDALKAETSVLCSKLEHEKQDKQRLETELKAVRSSLNSALQELDRSQAIRTDTERSLQRERDESLLFKDRQTHELSSLRENNNNLSQHLSRVEAMTNSLESELNRTLLLQSTQRDLTEAQHKIKDLEETLKDKNDHISKSTIKQESMQERMVQITSENMQLCHQLKDVQNKGIMKNAEKLNNQVHKPTVLCQSAEGSHDVWEKELTSGSQLSIHLVKLERSNASLADQQIIDQKIKRKNELQYDAKKKLKEFEVGYPDVSIRNQLEHRIENLEFELNKIKSAEDLSRQHSTQSALDRFRDFYAEEKTYRIALASKLEKANKRLEKAKAKLTNGQQRSNSFMENSFLNGSQVNGPVLDTSPSASLGKNQMFNRSLGFGRSVKR